MWPQPRKSTLREVRSLLHDHPDTIREVDHQGNTLLHQVARYSTSDVISLVLNADPALAYRLNNSRRAPLHVAAKYANAAAIAALLPRDKALLETRDDTGRTPLHLAIDSCRTGREAAFQLLYDASPSAAALTLDNGDTVLHAAVHSGNLSAVQRLAADRPDLLSARNQEGQLALDAAAVRYACVHSWTLDCMRRTRDSSAILATLLRATPTSGLGSVAALDARHGGSGTLLHRASMFGHVDVVRSILAVDSKAASVPDTFERLPIHVAADYSKHEVVRELLAVSRDFATALDEHLNTPLHYAAGDEMASDYFTVDLLCKAAPHAAHTLNIQSETPLMRAAHFGNVHALRYLLTSAPQTAEEPNEDGFLPICVTAMREDSDSSAACLQALLLHAPHTAKMRTPFGYTALHIAADYYRAGAVQAILQACPEAARVSTEDGLTALHVALMLKEDEQGLYVDDTSAVPVVRALLTTDPSLARSRLFFWDVDGCTPLHMAGALAMSGCVRELLAVDPQAVFLANHLGESALDWALRHGGKLSGCSRLMLSQRYEDAGAVQTVMGALRFHDSADAQFLLAITGNPPLPEGCWDLVPEQLEGALEALGAVLRAGSVNDVRQLVARVTAPGRARLVTVLAVLREVAPGLGDDAIRGILASAFDGAL